MTPRPVHLVDTNLIVRLLTDDPPALAEAAQWAFDDAAGGRHTLVVVPAVVAEVAYVLTSFYKQPRPSVADGLRRVLRLPGVRAREAGAVDRALDLFVARPKLKWVDAYLLALAEAEGAGVASFDRPLARAAPPGVPILDPSAV